MEEKIFERVNKLISDIINFYKGSMGSLSEMELNFILLFELAKILDDHSLIEITRTAALGSKGSRFNLKHCRGRSLN